MVMRLREDVFCSPPPPSKPAAGVAAASVELSPTPIMVGISNVSHVEFSSVNGGGSGVSVASTVVVGMP